MARISQVTRTILTTKVKALCLDIVEQKPFEAEFILSGTYKDTKHLMKALEAVANTETKKVVHVKSTEIVETLYGMSEQDFISNAKILPPRAVKTEDKKAAK